MDKNNKYLYILIRQDLSQEQMIVQSSHLAWEVSKKHSLDFHPCFVVIGVKNEESLNMEFYKLRDKNIDLQCFREPMFDNTLTAIGFLSESSEQRKMMKKYQLLKLGKKT